MVAIPVFFTGCATLETVSKAQRGSPKVYSGTRLDIHAIAHDETYMNTMQRKYDVVPPKCPGADLLFSFVLDTVVVPLTLSVAAYEVVFEPIEESLSHIADSQ